MQTLASGQSPWRSRRTASAALPAGTGHGVGVGRSSGPRTMEGEAGTSLAACTLYPVPTTRGSVPWKGRQYLPGGLYLAPSLGGSAPSKGAAGDEAKLWGWRPRADDL